MPLDDHHKSHRHFAANDSTARHKTDYFMDSSVKPTHFEVKATDGRGLLIVASECRMDGPLFVFFCEEAIVAVLNHSEIISILACIPQ